MIISGLLLSLTLIIVFIYAIHNYRLEKTQVSVTDGIVKELKIYASYVSSKSKNGVEWKIGQNFFWIEIHIPENKNKGIFSR